MDQSEVRSLAHQVLQARAASTNPYDALLLPRTASFQDVRAAYKRLILLHPDKNPGVDAAAEAFKCISSAWEAIKAQAPDARPDALRPTYDPPGGNRWAAFTAAAPAAPAAEPWAAAPPRPPPATAASKWGRAPSDTHRLLKVPNVVAADPALGRRASGEEARRRRSSSSAEAAAEAGGHPCAAPESDDGAQHGIACDDFYGGNSNKKRRSESGGGDDGDGSGSRGSPGPNMWRYGQGGGSLWSNAARPNPLAQLMRNPGAAVAPVAAAAAPLRADSPPAASPAKARVVRKASKAIIIDSDSEEEGEGKGDGGGEGKEKKESDSDGGWSSGSEEEEEGGGGGGGGGAEAQERENEGKTQALLKLLQAQQRDGVRRGAAATARARAASARRAAGRRGKARKRQSRLKLKPVTAAAR